MELSSNSMLTNMWHIHFWHLALFFDPKSTTSVIEDLLSDELPFINAKIGNALLVFEANIDEESTFTWYIQWSLAASNTNRVLGHIGD